MRYWPYYLLWVFGALIAQHPGVLVVLVVLVVVQRWIPDPFVLFATWGRISSLERQIESNPANATARRDLARVLIARRRPRKALRLLNEALARFPDDAELLFLKGQAASLVGEHQTAIDAIVEAVKRDGRLGFGEPYRVAGDSLLALGRAQEAVDAYERYTLANSSALDGFVKLARAAKDAGDKATQERALEEAFSTWRSLPRYAKRKQFAWWTRAHLARVF